MLSSCVNLEKNGSKNPRVARTNNRSIMVLSKSKVYDSNKLWFAKRQSRL